MIKELFKLTQGSRPEANSRDINSSNSISLACHELVADGFDQLYRSFTLSTMKEVRSGLTRQHAKKIPELRFEPRAGGTESTKASATLCQHSYFANTWFIT